MMIKPTLDLENSHSGSTDAAVSLPKTPTVEELKPKGTLITIKLNGIQFNKSCKDGPFCSASMSRLSQYGDDDDYSCCSDEENLQQTYETQEPEKEEAQTIKIGLERKQTELVSPA